MSNSIDYDTYSGMMLKCAQAYHHNEKSTIIGTGDFAVLCFDSGKLEVRRFENRTDAIMQAAWNKSNRYKKWTEVVDNFDLKTF